MIRHNMVEYVTIGQNMDNNNSNDNYNNNNNNNNNNSYINNNNNNNNEKKNNHNIDKMITQRDLLSYPLSKFL